MPYENGQLTGHCLIAGRVLGTGPGELHPALIRHGHFGDTGPAVRTQTGGLQIKEAQRGGAERLIGPRGHASAAAFLQSDVD